MNTANGIPLRRLPGRDGGISRGGAWCLLALLLAYAFSAPVAALTLTRGPYLQIGTPTSLVLRWRTDTPTDSVVSYGTTVGALTSTVTDGESTTEHDVTLSGLQPGTRYYYAVGSTAGMIAGAGDASYSFLTAPPSGSAIPTRIWVLGDSGGGVDTSIDEVRDEYMAYTGDNNTNLWLMLGDNAYDDGTDSEYQDAVFEMFPEMLRQVALWPTLGNHDVLNENDTQQLPGNIPYYSIFSLPTNGEAGGVPSATEEYYSFDYGNIHFICLNSFNVPRTSGSPMLTWLENDIAATDKQWIIAFWHHPPYSKGSHDSDLEKWSIEMRQYVMPILEDNGVDLVLTGHSHTYERSYLLNGHYGLSTTLESASILDAGDGREDGDGAYTKPDVTGMPNEGAVHIVSGSSSFTQPPKWLDRGMHPTMYLGLEERGSVIVDVDGARLDARFLDQSGVIRDYFTLSKEPDTTPPAILSVGASGASLVSVDFSEPLDEASAETAANYAIGDGIDVTGATLDGNGHTVTLNVTTLVPYVNYTLTVNNLQDLGGNPIAPGSQAPFTYDPAFTLHLQEGVAPTAGYAGTRDTHIREQAVNTTYGNSQSLEVRGNAGNNYTVLLKWDLSGLPAGAIIQSASLTLNATNGTADTYGLYELLRDWQESTATWNVADTGSPWETPGAMGTGDRGTALLAGVVGNSGALTIPLTAAGVAVIQDWVDGVRPNRGFVLTNATAGDGLTLSSSEATLPATRPRLTLVYTIPPPPDTDDDGLTDSLEATLGTDPLLSDTDDDGVSDYDEVAFDGNAASYTPGLDSDPLDPDTDGDRLNDGVEIAHGSNPLDPASYPSLADGDLAPLGSPDGSINAADYLLSLRLTLGLLTPTVLELAHGDLYPPGTPDGLINLSDTLLQQQLLFISP